jgi:protein NrfD
LEWKNTLGIIGILLALGVSVYTGVLLLVSIVPLWRNLSLPLLLFLSAISTGFAGGMILAMLSLGKGKPDVLKAPLRFIQQSYRVILPFYLLMAFAFVSSLVISSVSRTDAIYLITGWRGFIWWAGVIGVGILVPLVFVMKKKAIAMRRAWVIFSCVLIGGFLLRIVLILAGQRS